LPVLEPDRKKRLAAFSKAAGFRFKSVALLNLSFVHRSASNEVGARLNNERLEFLGDSILGAACATILYDRYPDKPEGELARLKSVIVSEEVLSGVARMLRIDEMLFLGKGEELSGGRGKKAILADTLEAVIGALYLDSGYRSAFSFVSCHFSPQIERVMGEGHRDYKSLLQELCQRDFRCYHRKEENKIIGVDNDFRELIEEDKEIKKEKSKYDISGDGMMSMLNKVGENVKKIK
jgi:ribonuclease-3